MGHWRCKVCNYITGAPETHRFRHIPDWEHCTCGSGAHPRRCELHPEAYQQHVEELNALADADERLDRLASNLATAAALCEAFSLGEVNGIEHALRGYIVLNPEWHPGCGRSALPSGGRPAKEG